MPDARAACDLVDADVRPVLGERLGRGDEHAVEVALRVRAEGGHQAVASSGSALASASIRATCRCRSSAVITTSAASMKMAPAGEGPVEAGDERLRVLGAAERRGVAGRDRREDREPERTADLLRGVEQPRGEALVLVLEPGRRDQRQRHEDGAHAERGEDERGQDVGEVGAVDRAGA